MDNSITNDNNDDVEILIRNWKKIPVIGTQVLMNNFPYAIAPWEHWNLLIDELKKNNNKSSPEKPEESEPKEPVDNFEETHVIRYFFLALGIVLYISLFT